MKTLRSLVFLLSLILFLACSEQGKKPQTEQPNESEVGQIIDYDSSENDVEEEEIIQNVAANQMSPEEAEILEMTITAYEQNAEDLISWAEVAETVKNVEEANDVMIEYMEVQMRFNESIKKVEDFTITTLGKEYVFSNEYEENFQGYLADPERTSRSKRAVGATMKLINAYGEDDTFVQILKKLEDMNRHKMKELNERKK